MFLVVIVFPSVPGQCFYGKTHNILHDKIIVVMIAFKSTVPPNRSIGTLVYVIKREILVPSVSNVTLHAASRVYMELNLCQN